MTAARLSSTLPVGKDASLPLFRWAVLITLLAVECLAISLRYDAARVSAGQPLYQLIARAGWIGRLGIAVAVASLVLAGPQCHRELGTQAERIRRRGRQLPATLGSLLAFCLFYWLSSDLLEGGTSTPLSGWPLVIAWFLSGLATLVLWGLAVMPAGLWGWLIGRCAGRLAVGGGLAAAVCGVCFLAMENWRALSLATAKLVYALLEPFFSHVVFFPERRVVGTTSFSAFISYQCSGFEGMGLMAALMGISLWVFRRELRFPRALVVLPLGVGLAWLLNGVRIALLVALGTWGYSEIAIEGFHSLAGWLFFLVLGLGLVAAVRHMPFFNVLPAEVDSRVRTDAGYLIPAMVIIATAMVTGALSPGFDRYYPVRVLTAAAALGFCRHCYEELRFTCSWQSICVGIGVFALWIAMEPRPASTSAVTNIQAGLASLPAAWAALWVIFRIVGSVIAVPVAEELAFRGYLTRRLLSADFQTIPPGRMTWWSLLISSLLFGALHGRWLAGTLAGIAYALAYRSRGELADAIVAHGVTNGLIALAVLTTGWWSLWS